MNKSYIIMAILLAFSAQDVLSQNVDYSVVSIKEEVGLNFTKITSDNDYVCMPQVIRKRGYIDWLSNRILDISVDGSKLAYLSFRSNATNIFIKDLNRMSGSVQRTNRQNVLDFTYSPDGSQICFSEMVNDVSRIFVTDANKGYICRQITNNDLDYTPVFSWDMNQIFFSRQEIQDLGIWCYSIRDNFLSSVSRGMNPCPINGEKALICVRPAGDGRNEIWKIDYDSGVEECLVSDANHSYTTPSISPDGKWLLFVGSSNIIGENFSYQNTDIYVCRTDGSQMTQITYHAADDLSPAWSRDGRYIYFISQRGSATGTANVWRMNFNLYE